MKTLYIDQTGPLVRYDGELLHISDLNPEIETRWRMSRLEMLRFGIRAAWAAIIHPRKNK